MEFERTITGGVESTAGWSKTEVGGPPGPRATIPAEGSRLGRYVLLSPLGEGGMGVVFAAYDPELDRRVALKLLAGAGHSEAARLRMLREAQAMARLQHPNVVTVHDVGATDEQVYVAMEHVRGVTLRQWLAQERRPWPRVLEVMRAVARGLSAAHEAGLVHRDVKPENVMIGDDGRVLVMDFGLARADGSAPEPTPMTLSSGSLLSSDLTHAGALLGTPHYMAPEGLLGGAIDARADQFSWCVTCWEALHGERPFVGDDLAGLRRTILDGKPRTPPGRAVPGAVRRVLARGLAVDPRRRHPSMQALLAALDAALRRRRWRFAGYVAAVLSLGAGAAAGWRHLESAAAAERCAAAGAEIAATWGEEPARRVADAFAATGRADAADVFARTRPWLDAYADAWARARTELCAAAGSRAPAREDERALECLEDRRAGLDALVTEVFARAEASTLLRATAVAAQLPPVSECADPRRLALAPAPPEDPAARARVRELRARFERAASLHRGGDYEAAARVGDEVLRDAEALGWSPLILQARLLRGDIESRRGDFAAAEATLESVVLEAEAEGHDLLVADASTNLTFVVGFGLGRPQDGVRWGRLGLAVLRRLGEDEGLFASNTYAVLGIAEEARGEYAEAQRLKEKVLALRERHLGPEHPSVGTAHDLLGVALTRRGDLEAALREHERGLSIRLASLGAGHLEVANSYINLGNVERLMHRHGRALEMQEEARRIMTRALGPEHPHTAIALENAAVCRYRLGRLDEALATHREALAIRERVLPPGHPHLAASHEGIADVLRRRGDLEGAAAGYRRAIEILEAAEGADHPDVASVLVRQAGCQRERGDLAGALASLERARAIGERRELAPELRAELEFGLGQALWERGQERGRARALVRGAAPRLAALDREGVEQETRERRDWLVANEAALAAAEEG